MLYFQKYIGMKRKLLKYKNTLIVILIAAGAVICAPILFTAITNPLGITYGYTQKAYKEIELPSYLRLTSTGETGDPIDSPSQEGWFFHYSSTATDQQTLMGIVASLKQSGYNVGVIQDAQVLRSASNLQPSQSISFSSTNAARHTQVDVSLSEHQHVEVWIYKLSQ